MSGVSSQTRASTNIGGLDTVETSTLNGFDFVALGHLHRPQSVGYESIQYQAHRCDTHLRVHTKSFNRIELGASGEVAVSRLAVHPPRDLVLVEGTLDELLADPGQARPADLVVARL